MERPRRVYIPFQLQSEGNPADPLCDDHTYTHPEFPRSSSSGYCSLSMDRKVYEHWRAVAAAEGLKTDTQLASFFINLYKYIQAGIQDPELPCRNCSTPITPVCPKCLKLKSKPFKTSATDSGKKTTLSEEGKTHGVEDGSGVQNVKTIFQGRTIIKGRATFVSEKRSVLGNLASNGSEDKSFIVLRRPAAKAGGKNSLIVLENPVSITSEEKSLLGSPASSANVEKSWIGNPASSASVKKSLIGGPSSSASEKRSLLGNPASSASEDRPFLVRRRPASDASEKKSILVLESSIFSGSEKRFIIGTPASSASENKSLLGIPAPGPNEKQSLLGIPGSSVSGGSVSSNQHLVYLDNAEVMDDVSWEWEGPDIKTTAPEWSQDDQQHKADPAKSESEIHNYCKRKRNSGRQRKKKFKCRKCSKSFNTDGRLKFHAAYAHKGGNLYKCSVCDKAFCSKFHLESVHMKVHNIPVKQKSATHFQTEHTLDMVVHDTQKKCKCVICGKCFKAAYYLSMHMRRMHQDKAEAEQQVYLVATPEWPDRCPQNISSGPGSVTKVTLVYQKRGHNAGHDATDKTDKS